jgi:hypothetical protein
MRHQIIKANEIVQTPSGPVHGPAVIALDGGTLRVFTPDQWDSLRRWEDAEQTRDRAEVR